MVGTIPKALMVLFLQASPVGGIEGVVRNASTDEALSQVQVTAVHVSNGAAAAPGSSVSIPPVLTDSQGKFVIKDLPPGAYRLFAVRSDLAAQEHGQRLLNRVGAPVEVAAGQTTGKLEFRLTRVGAVTGHITDKSSEPVAHVSVQLLLPAYDTSGRRSLQSIASATTDDRGEYRVFRVPPGSYYVSATVGDSEADALALAQGFLGTGNGALQAGVTETLAAKAAVVPPAPAGYGVTYFPGTLDLTHAATLDVTSGPAAVMANLQLLMQPTVRVLGRLIDGQTGQPPKNATIVLNGLPGTGAKLRAAKSYNGTTGAFEISDVSPGSYMLSAISASALGLFGALSTAIDGLSESNPRASGAALPKTAQVHLDIASSDVDNIVLKTAASLSIHGQLSIDGMAAPSLPAGFDRIRVRILPSASSVPSQQAAARSAANPPGPPQIKQDGSFTLSAEANCECEIVVTGLPPDAYVKGIRFGSMDLPANQLNISDSIPGPLVITIAPSGAKVEGTLVNKGLNPVPGVEVVLIPQQRNRQDLYRTAVSDPSGHFIFRGVPLGAYKIFAWEDIEPNGFRNPEVLRTYESLGQTIAITDSVRPVNVTVIPAHH